MGAPSWHILHWSHGREKETEMQTKVGGLAVNSALAHKSFCPEMAHASYVYILLVEVNHIAIPIVGDMGA